MGYDCNRASRSHARQVSSKNAPFAYTYANYAPEGLSQKVLVQGWKLQIVDIKQKKLIRCQQTHDKLTQTLQHMYVCVNLPCAKVRLCSWYDRFQCLSEPKWGRAGSGRKVPPVNKDVKENNQIMACLFIQTQPPTDWRILYFRLALSKLVHQHVDQLVSVAYIVSLV